MICSDSDERRCVSGVVQKEEEEDQYHHLIKQQSLADNSNAQTLSVSLNTNQLDDYQPGSTQFDQHADANRYCETQGAEVT